MALKGNQKKLDKNNNNRIDAQDFKILKAEKAKGRGMGLQDEKVKPGKVMKAKRGDFMKRRMELAGVKSAPGTTAKSAMGKTFSGYQKVFQTGVSAGDKTKATSTIIGVKPKLPEASKSSKIARRALKAAQATSLGKKLLLPVAGAVAVSQYLKSKMKKKEDKNKKTLKDFREQKKPGVPSEKTKTINKALNKLNKKMGGGMMMRPTNYAEGGDASRSPMAQQQRRGGPRKPKPGRRAGIPSLGGKKKDDSSFKNIIITKGGMYSHTKPEIDEKKGRHYRQHKSYDASPRLISDAEGKTTSLRSMNVGGSVTVKTKLGRNKPTKMY